MNQHGLAIACLNVLGLARREIEDNALSGCLAELMGDKGMSKEVGDVLKLVEVGFEGLFSKGEWEVFVVGEKSVVDRKIR